MDPRKRQHHSTRGAAALLLMGVVAMALPMAMALALLAGAPPAWAKSGKERLADDLGLITGAQLTQAKNVPDRDKKRTADCLAKAIAADVPEADAGRLADMFDGKVDLDKALQIKWLAIAQKDNPGRNAQVMAAINKLCPDVGPYVKPMMQ